MSYNNKNHKIIGIMACDAHGTIGLDNGLPWKCPGDMKHFLNMIMGNVIIMGYNTYLSIPTKTLNSCDNIVFSRNHNLHCNKKLQVVHNLSNFSSLIIPKNKKIYMIGGQQIFALFMQHDLLSEFFLTKIHGNYSGDTHISIKEISKWKKFSILQNCSDYTIYHY